MRVPTNKPHLKALTRLPYRSGTGGTGYVFCLRVCRCLMGHVPCAVYCFVVFQHLAVVHGMLLSARLPVKPVPWYLFAVSTGFTNEIRARVIKIVEIIGILQRCKCEHQMQDTLETTLVYNFRATPPCSCQL